MNPTRAAAALALTLMGFIAAAAAAPAPGGASPSAEDLLEPAWAAYAKADYDEALRLADRAAAAAPKEATVYAFRGRVHVERRDWPKAVADFDRAIGLDPTRSAVFQRRGEAHFRLGHFEQSVADFDQVIRLKPDEAPRHWQRGISLYLAGRFDEGRKQFELHQTVNDDDAENAAYHFACVARARGVAEARAALLPIAEDERAPMMQVYAMLAGRAKPAEVLAAVHAGKPNLAELRDREFYANLYVGLYYDALGQADLARTHFREAVAFAPDNYMGDVARAHAKALEEGGKAKAGEQKKGSSESRRGESK